MSMWRDLWRKIAPVEKAEETPPPLRRRRSLMEVQNEETCQMAFSPNQSPIFGGGSVVVAFGASTRLASDARIYLIFHGQKRRHVVQAAVVNGQTLQANIPEHDRAESVRLHVCEDAQDSVKTLATTQFQFVLTDTHYLAEHLLNSVNTDLSDGLEEYNLEEDGLDERLVKAIGHLGVDKDWNVLGKAGDTPRETLLHLCARHRLRTLTCFLLRHPGGRAALLVRDLAGRRPREVLGSEDTVLARLLDPGGNFVADLPSDDEDRQSESFSCVNGLYSLSSSDSQLSPEDCVLLIRERLSEASEVHPPCEAAPPSHSCPDPPCQSQPRAQAPENIDTVNHSRTSDQTAGHDKNQSPDIRNSWVDNYSSLDVTPPTDSLNISADSLESACLLSQDSLERLSQIDERNSDSDFVEIDELPLESGADSLSGSVVTVEEVQIITSKDNAVAPVDSSGAASPETQKRVSVVAESASLLGAVIGVDISGNLTISESMDNVTTVQPADDVIVDNSDVTMDKNDGSRTEDGTSTRPRSKHSSSDHSIPEEELDSIGDLDDDAFRQQVSPPVRPSKLPETAGRGRQCQSTSSIPSIHVTSPHSTTTVIDNFATRIHSEGDATQVSGAWQMAESATPGDVPPTVPPQTQEEPDPGPPPPKIRKIAGTGKNCVLPGCSNFWGKTKGKGVSYMRFPREESAWKKELINAITKYRADPFDPDKATICSEHFEKRHLLFSGGGYKISPGRLPTLNLPRKSQDTPQVPPRKAPAERPPPAEVMRVKYYNLEDVKKDAVNITGWATLRNNERELLLGRLSETDDLLAKLMINDDLECSLQWRGHLIPAERLKLRLEERGLRQVLEDIENAQMCRDMSAKNCRFILDKGHASPSCRPCQNHAAALLARESRPILPKTPLVSASRSALIAEVRRQRDELRALKAKPTSDVVVSPEIKEGIEMILENTPEATMRTHVNQEFLELFWKEQKAAKERDPRGVRYHPMVIKFALFLHAISPKAYETLKKTGVLHLPNETTLRDYSHCLPPKEGCQTEVFNEIRKVTETLPEWRRYANLMHDEMHIRGDLVYDVRTGALVGFVGTDCMQFKATPQRKQLASHVLAFMVQGIGNNIRKVVAYFPTCTATADVIYPIMWRVINYCEQAGLRIITETSDKASTNQSLIRLHAGGKVTATTPNHFAPDEERSLYFISDPPHLMKTIRNNLENSGNTRYLWVNEKHVLWGHVVKLVRMSLAGQLHLPIACGLQHIELNPATRMSVKLATQILSERMSKCMVRYCGDEAAETAKFLLKFDVFFDCLNGSSYDEAYHHRKPNRAPYHSKKDRRFQTLLDVLKYLDDWRLAVARRPDFTDKEKERMMLSQQTQDGIYTTVHGFIGATKFLLDKGVPRIFPSVFNQDALEEHFGLQRTMGVRSRNPSMQEVRYNEKKLQLAGSLAKQLVPRGNTKGRAKTRPAIEVESTPLPRRNRRQEHDEKLEEFRKSLFEAEQ